MLLRRIPLLIAAAVLLAAPTALAEQEEFEADREAGYLGISGIYGVEEFTDGDSAGLRLRSGGGFSARVGFRMFRWAAMELEGEYLDSLGKDVASPWNVTANLKAIYPFGPEDRIQPFLLGGAGVMSAEFTRAGSTTEETDGVFKIGGGVDFFVTRNWVAQVATSWVSHISREPGIRYVAVKAGVTYNFR